MSDRPLPSAAAFLAGLSLSLVLLVGCGSGEESIASDSSGESVAASAAAATDTTEKPVLNVGADNPEDGAGDSPSTESTSPEARAADPSNPLAQAPALPPARDVGDLAEESQRLEALTPVSLTIERLGLTNTTVTAEGVQPNGDMAIPPPLDVGWYRYGPVPGEPGSAVLAGHIASDGIDGAFRYLDRLEPGDSIIVNRADGSSTTFVVSEELQVAKTDLPFDEVFARSGPSRIALITCGGEFDYSARSYEDNVVVIADLVST